MSLSGVALPYGIRDIKLTQYTDAAGTVLGDTLDLPNGRTLGFTESEDFETLRGDDRDVATHGNGAQVKWTLESGGLPFEVFKAMGGGTVTSSGTSPTQMKVYAKKVTDQRPYFRLEGQAISDSGGDIHCILHRCKATGDLTGEFKDGEFFLTACDGIAVAMPNGDFQDELYRFVNNESVTAIDVTDEAPVIDTITPDGAAEGAIVTIVGTHFSNVSSVTFGGTAGTDLNVISDTLLTVTLPAGDAGDVEVVVSTDTSDSTPVTYTRA